MSAAGLKVRVPFERWALRLLFAGLMLAAVHADMGLVQWAREMPALVACLAGSAVAALPARYAWNRLLGFITLASGVAAAIVWWPLLHLLLRHTTGPMAVQVAEVTTARGIAFLLILAIFGLTLLCGYLLFERRQALTVTIILGVAFLIRADVTRVYEERFGLVVLGVSALLLLAGVPRAFSRIMLVPCALSGVLVAAAWSLPTWSTPWTHPALSPVISLAQVGVGEGSPTTLSLEGPFHPSDTPVMSITLNRKGVRPYWREIVFDQYDGHTWRTSAVSDGDSPAGASLLVGQPDPRSSLLSAHVRPLTPMRSLVGPGPLVRSSVATSVMYSTSDPQPIAVEASDPLGAGSGYDVQSVAVPSWQPASPDAFLQLPPLGGEVHRLARLLTRSDSTPFQQALQIQAYLRDSGIFQYDAGAGSPADEDAVTAFLFRLHRGYCNQFATAMVVLAREVGIPARLVSGYDSGTWTGNAFLIRARDAHSWVEAYIDGAGWLTFDPTPGSALDPQLAGVAARRAQLPPGFRPPGPLPGKGSGLSIRQRRSAQYQHLNGGNSAAPQDGDAGLMVTGALILLLIAAVGAAAYSWRPLSVPQLYRAVIRAAPASYGGLEPWETPLEFAQRFAPALGGTARDKTVYSDVHYIAELYMRQTYAGRAPSVEEIRDARRAWFRLRRKWSLSGMILDTVWQQNDHQEVRV